MFPAIGAILTDAQSFRVVLFIFHGCVIAIFATIASQRNNDSVIFLSHKTSLLNQNFNRKTPLARCELAV
jgi:hypothetical protein